MGKVTTTGSVASEYLSRFPKTPIMTLAKKMYKEEPKVFSSLEHARSTLRNHAGLAGDKTRRHMKDKSNYRPITNNRNPFDLPETHSKKQNVWYLPTSIKKVGLLSDIHFPYHDEEALTAALNDCKSEKVDAIFINGDAIDFYQCSFHEKDPRKTSISGELEMAREFFASLKKHFPNVKKYYIPGNHEVRLERYLKVKAPELLDVEEFRLDVLLRVREFDVEYIPYASKCYFGKLLVEHGDKMKGTGGVNPARTLALRLKRHAICGHFHRTTENVSKIYDGDSIVTYSTGCLCELEPGYMEVNEHNHGHAIIEMLGDGHFNVKNKKIVNGKVY